MTPEMQRQRRNEAWLKSVRRDWEGRKFAWVMRLLEQTCRAIAEGHNDPRGLARETLDLITQCGHSDPRKEGEAGEH